MFKNIQKALVITFLICFVLGCKESIASGEIDQAELLSRMVNKSIPVIIDARSSEEYAESHIPGAINIPHNSFSEMSKDLKFSKNNELIVYCESGRRAEQLINTLEKNGYFEVRHLLGDMREWRNAGLQTEKN